MTDPSTEIADERTGQRPAELVLSEERLSASAMWAATERVVLRRQVVTETRQVEVTVRREELVVSREAADATSREGAGAGDPDHGTHEPIVMVLREEVPQVTTRVQPYEQVTVTVERTSGTETIHEQLRHEELEVQGVAGEGVAGEGVDAAPVSSQRH